MKVKVIDYKYVGGGCYSVDCKVGLKNKYTHIIRLKDTGLEQDYNNYEIIDGDIETLLVEDYNKLCDAVYDFVDDDYNMSVDVYWNNMFYERDYFDDNNYHYGDYHIEKNMGCLFYDLPMYKENFNKLGEYLLKDTDKLYDWAYNKGLTKGFYIDFYYDCYGSTTLVIGTKCNMENKADYKKMYEALEQLDINDFVEINYDVMDYCNIMWGMDDMDWLLYDRENWTDEKLKERKEMYRNDMLFVGYDEPTTEELEQIFLLN